MKTLDNALSLFYDEKIPKWADTEEETDEPSWRISEEGCNPTFPGGGLNRYPMLYIGEGNNKMMLIDKGKEIWSFCAGKGWEYDDVWMLTNGNIVFSRMSWAAEITPDKKYVWRIDMQEGEELHTLQPIGLEKVMYVINKKPFPVVYIQNVYTNEVEYSHEIPYAPDASVHGQFRRFRITENNTFLAACLSMNVVKEYDMDFNEIWSYEIEKPWAAIRLKNGNTLITGEKEGVQREVNKDKEVVWEFYLKDLPKEYKVTSSQSAVRLDNGNTVICSMGNKGEEPQLIEVTKDKEIVWVLKDWKNLGPATAIQILSEEGVPENPGECQR